MKVPLILRLLSLAAMGYGLWRANKKTILFAEKPYVLLEGYDKLEFDSWKSGFEGDLVKWYRAWVRGKEFENPIYSAVYFYVILEKTYKKSGIFRLFWFDNHYVVALYQVFDFLDLLDYKNSFATILKEINSSVWKGYLEQGMLPPTGAFSVSGEMKEDAFVSFDSIFRLETLKNKILEKLKLER
ncbi:MAG: hypothetical protein ACRCVT_11970 [Leadbetterella sp.]